MKKDFEVLVNTYPLKGYLWEAEKPIGNLIIGTGMCEYAGRYEEFALFLNKNGFNVYGLDFLGQGRNAPSIEKQEIWPKNGFDLNVEALNETVFLAKKNGLPTSLFAHSMGSFMVQAYLQKHHLEVDKSIICGTNGGQGFLMKTGYLLSKILVHKGNWEKPNSFLTNLSIGGYSKAIKDSKTKSDWLSFNEENVNKYEADPYCGATPTGGFWKEFLKGLSKLWNIRNINKTDKNEKILIISGEYDVVGRFGKGPKWLFEKYKKAGIKNVRLTIYPKMRHEILNEDKKQTVFDDILSFLTK